MLFRLVQRTSREMVTLVVATTVDPASIGPASTLLAMPGWHPGPPVQDMSSFVNRGVRLLKHDNSIVREDHLDRRWEAATGEVVDEVIFMSKHTAASNRPALTIHPIGVPHLCEDEVPPAGGKPGWAAPPNPRIGPWLRLLKSIAESHNLTPEFELVWEGLGLGGGPAVGDWSRNNGQNKILLGIGGGHYAPRHMDIALKDGVWVGHLLSGYSLPMEDLGQSNLRTVEEVGGAWREAIKVAFETTKAAFPGGQVLAHIDHKSFKGWQRAAITGFLAEQTIKIGKPCDFC
ncbi:D-aminoacyl-tRNA deacylase-like isoform X2 [Diospyros lotus]|uniref:D-aminoacyl-tRNA deacylase-like isoform X2 n=1 Tax=Diospyros lotus TaxID=55363 RepID=UPI002251ADF9|nr:D-aminoacyl-tRNA deacylase-like isoform X2 [Diospyros lotus]